MIAADDYSENAVVEQPAIVPSCSTIYLDKPMRNHTLMQAIAQPTGLSGTRSMG
jgi:hypothetical protein